MSRPLMMRALTIRQPYADAIAHGEKRAENRTRPTKYLGPLLIHAGTARHSLGLTPAQCPPGSMWPDVRGAVLAVGELVGCHQASEGCCPVWGMDGYWHWELADVRPLAVPVPAKGQLGLWTPTPEVLAAVEAQHARMEVAW